ncbi:MAG: PRC-barrel domain-containing protein [Kiloniellales bacterium]|nr:PRC-barrel domain-containing protein [Kiloniellales bacterium]
MQLAREWISLPVITIDGGHEVGKVKDLYLDEDLKHVAAVYLGSEGLLNKSGTFIRQADVVTVGKDALLVQNADVVFDEAETPELSEWLEIWIRRDDLRDREMNTSGGTKVGRIGDIILDDDASVAGFSLAQAYVSGTVAGNKAIGRSAIVDVDADGPLTVDLAEAERANFKIVHEGLLGQPSVLPAAESEPEKVEA